MAVEPLVLVLNAGSSSLKVALIAANGERLLSLNRPIAPKPQSWLPELLQPWRQRIALVGHRVVHGGETFTAPTRLDASVEAALEALVPLAPLHNGPALAMIRWCRQAIEQQELPLIEQEVKLREQRYSLEEREYRLRNEAQSFSMSTGRR